MNWRELERRAVRTLDPLDADPSGPGDALLGGAWAGGSDYDLNPGWRPSEPPSSRAAVLIPIVDRPEGPTVLLTRRAEALSRHAGQIAFPGGRIDPGESPEQAALREAEEEVGLPPDRVTLIGRSSPYATVTGFAITPVVGLVAPPFALRLNPAEVAEAFELPLGVALDEDRYERRFRDFDAGRRWFYAVAHDDRVIWGATAGMLRALRGRLLGQAMEDAA